MHTRIKAGVLSIISQTGAHYKCGGRAVCPALCSISETAPCVQNDK